MRQMTLIVNALFNAALFCLFVFILDLLGTVLAVREEAAELDHPPHVPAFERIHLGVLVEHDRFDPLVNEFYHL